MSFNTPIHGESIVDTSLVSFGTVAPHVALINTLTDFGARSAGLPVGALTPKLVRLSPSGGGDTGGNMDLTRVGGRP